MMIICVRAMNDCIWRTRAAAITPNAVIENASSSSRPNISSSRTGV